MNLFSTAKRKERQAADRVYAAALTAARRPALYLRHGVPDTFEGRFEMVTLHLFPLLHRLMHDPGDAPELARAVAESFVDDMDDALRGVGVSDTRVPKRMSALYGSFAGRITAYREALGAGEGALAAAVARNVFPDGSGEGHAGDLAAYLQRAVRQMRGAELSRIRSGDVPFPELPVVADGR